MLYFLIPSTILLLLWLYLSWELKKREQNNLPTPHNFKEALKYTNKKTSPSIAWTHLIFSLFFIFIFSFWEGAIWFFLHSKTLVALQLVVGLISFAVLTKGRSNKIGPINQNEVLIIAFFLSFSCGAKFFLPLLLWPYLRSKFLR